MSLNFLNINHDSMLQNKDIMMGVHTGKNIVYLPLVHMEDQRILIDFMLNWVVVLHVYHIKVSNLKYMRLYILKMKL